MGPVILVATVESRFHRQMLLYFLLLLKSFLSYILHVLTLSTSYQSTAKFMNMEPGINKET